MARTISNPTKEKCTGKQFGIRLRKFRMDSGMSLQKFADEIGVNRNYISELEKGDRVPSFNTLISIIKVLNISPDLLLRDYLNETQKTQIRADLLVQKLSALSEENQNHLENLLNIEIEFLKNNNKGKREL